MSGIQSQAKNNTYSRAFKETVVQEHLQEGVTLSQLARKPGDLGSGRSHGNAQANTQAGGHFLRQHPIRGQLKMPCTTNVIHGINYFVFLPVYLTGGSSKRNAPKMDTKIPSEQKVTGDFLLPSTMTALLNSLWARLSGSSRLIQTDPNTAKLHFGEKPFRNLLIFFASSFNIEHDYYLACNSPYCFQFQ